VDAQPRSRSARVFRPILSAIAIGALLGVTIAGPVAGATGPSTTTAPYMLPVASGVGITSMLTVGDAGSASNGYEMVGIPDGLGVIGQGANVVLYMNHELRDQLGLVHRHGQTGAFVSRWVIDPATLRVKEGSDWINPGVQYWDYPSASYVTSGARFADGTLQDLPFGRFCSGTLSDPGDFYNATTGNGWRGQIYFGNEEDGDVGRTFGITKEGDASAFPRIGLFASENTKPAHNQTDTTLVIGDEDGPSNGSQLFVYIGTKQQSGPPMAKAGLMNGTPFVLDAVNEAVSTDAQWRTANGHNAARVDLAEIDWSQTGAAQNSQALAAGLSLNRIEDGHWDPSHPNDFYFLTTEGGQTNGLNPNNVNFRDGGGLWRLRFDDIEDPAAGGSLQLLLDGSEELGTGESNMNKPDNMAIDSQGNLLIQEDPGNNNHLARIVAYRIADGALGVVARFDVALFGPGANTDPTKLTIDEESSGIVDTETLLGAGTFLFDAQVHTAKGLPAGTGPGTVEEFVERGQLLQLTVDDWSAVYGD
jgi:hypothetical protein